MSKDLNLKEELEKRNIPIKYFRYEEAREIILDLENENQIESINWILDPNKNCFHLEDLEFLKHAEEKWKKVSNCSEVLDYYQKMWKKREEEKEKITKILQQQYLREYKYQIRCIFDDIYNDDKELAKLEASEKAESVNDVLDIVDDEDIDEMYIDMLYSDGYDSDDLDLDNPLIFEIVKEKGYITSRHQLEEHLEMSVEDYFELKKLKRRYKSSYFQANKTKKE